jgi:hypothetical protein
MLMGWRRRTKDPRPDSAPAPALSAEDEQALADYRESTRHDPAEPIRPHEIVAFEKLTAEQLQLLFLTETPQPRQERPRTPAVRPAEERAAAPDDDDEAASSRSGSASAAGFALVFTMVGSIAAVILGAWLSTLIEPATPTGGTTGVTGGTTSVTGGTTAVTGNDFSTLTRPDFSAYDLGR